MRLMMNRRPVDRFRAACSGAVGRAAFSLIELVIVLVIVAMLAAIAVPRYGQSQARYRADAAAARVATDLQRARDTARATSGSQLFMLSGRHTYAFGPSERAASTVDLSGEPYGVQTVGGDLGTEDVTFDAFGKPSGATWFYLGLGDEWRRIDVDAGGVVKVSRATRVQAGVTSTTATGKDISTGGSTGLADD